MSGEGGQRGGALRARSAGSEGAGPAMAAGGGGEQWETTAGNSGKQQRETAPRDGDRRAPGWKSAHPSALWLSLAEVAPSPLLCPAGIRHFSRNEMVLPGITPRLAPAAGAVAVPLSLGFAISTRCLQGDLCCTNKASRPLHKTALWPWSL